MKAAKTTIKIILVIVAIAIIAVGGYFLKTKGLNFPENGIYNVNNIIKESMPYIIKAGICLALVLVYLMIRYNKLGVIKVAITSLASILVMQAVVIAIITITRLPITNLFFALLLLTYAVTILVITAIYEKKLKTA